MNRTRFGLLVASMMYIALANGEEATPLPTPEAKKAQAEYLSDLTKLEAVVKLQRAELLKKYITTLETAIEHSTKTGKLDDALKLREEREKLLKPEKTRIDVGADQLTQALADTGWVNGNGQTIFFHANHTTKASWHNDVGMWVAVGPNEVRALLSRKFAFSQMLFEPDGQSFLQVLGKDRTVWKRVKVAP